jgi:hypothetical protein
MEEEVKRISVRLSAPLYRALNQEAQQAGLDFSKYLRRVVLECMPHLAAFEDVGKVMAASKEATAPAEYAPYLASMKRRLEAALEDLNTFEARAAQRRAHAEHELKAALADVDMKLQQAGALTDMAHLFSKFFAQEGRDEAR